MNINLTMESEGALQEFFKEDLKVLVSKYQSISREKVERIQQLFESLKQNTSLNQIKVGLDLALELSEVENHIAEMYLWMKGEGMTISIKETKEYFDRIKEEGCVEVGGYLLTFEDTNLTSYARETLLELMEDRHQVEHFFDKDQLAEMWIEETSKEEAVEDLISSVTDPIKELLELYFHEVCTCRDGSVLIASFVDF